MSEEVTLDEFAQDGDEKPNQQDTEQHLPEIDEIPSDWRLVTVEEIADDLIGGGTPSKSNEEYWGGKIPWASVKDLNGIELAETEDYITDSGVENSATNLIPKDSIVISTRMTVGEPFINRTEMAINQDMKAIIPDAEQVNLLFFVYSLWDKDPYLKSLGRGTTVDGITTNDLALTHLGLPPFPEQRKIATVIHTVDRAIEKTQEIIDQEERVLNGTLNELFNRGLDASGTLRPSPDDSPKSYQNAGRFSVPTDWNVDSLQKLCTENITYGIVQPGPHVEEGVPYINTEDMTDGNIPTKGLSKTSQEISEKYSRSEIHEGELVVTIRATIGAVDQVPPELDGANLTRGTARVVPGDSIDNHFLLWAIRSNVIQSELEARVKGTTFDEINLDQLGKIPVPYPTDKNEQAAIVDILSTIDSKLESEQSYLESLHRLKRGLMQDLLSGTVRTTDTNIEVPDEIAQHG